MMAKGSKWAAIACLGLVSCGVGEGREVRLDDLTAWFPAEATVRDAEEPLRATARIAHAYDEDGARFEIARFVTLRPLDEDDARVLVDKTVRALLALPRIVHHEVTRDDGRTAIVAIRFEDGTRGRWHLEIVGDRTFWQLSVVGDDEPAVWERARRFFASIRLL